MKEWTSKLRGEWVAKLLKVLLQWKTKEVLVKSMKCLVNTNWYHIIYPKEFIMALIQGYCKMPSNMNKVSSDFGTIYFSDIATER